MRRCADTTSRGLQLARPSERHRTLRPVFARQWVSRKTRKASISVAPRGLKPAALRPAFSLAEIMIAIGILGVGMLMVAATFPVGLDQARIVSEQTMAPMVAQDALAQLGLLLDEPNSFKRIPDSAINPTAWLLSFRESIRGISSNGVIRAHLSNGNAAADPLLSPPPYVWTGLNELLVAPYGTTVRGASTRFYPSIRATTASSAWPYGWSLPVKTNSVGEAQSIEPPYTWSALYRKYSVGGRDHVQFFVFVNRRGTEWPSDWPNTASVDTTTYTTWTPGDPVLPLPLLDSGNKPIDTTAFSEGGYFLGTNGTILRVKSIDRAAQTLTLDAAPGTPIFWFIRSDSATGRSPCIGIYSRSFPL